MKRDHQRKTPADKGYYIDHACEETFVCKVCGMTVEPEGAGSDHRNHCPNCLSSIHVDEEPGDRESECHGVMEPIAVWVRKNGEWAIIHRCKVCGKLSSNRVAADDNPVKLMSIAMRPIAEPPFPIERMKQITNVMFGEKKDEE
ncbi:MAG: RNHCP domain-containing protein [Clostridiales bacterium]|nr:RNHCP domain-containing protein [Clostridiales bacterium]